MTAAKIMFVIFFVGAKHTFGGGEAALQALQWLRA